MRGNDEGTWFYYSNAAFRSFGHMVTGLLITGFVAIALFISLFVFGEARLSWWMLYVFCAFSSIWQIDMYLDMNARYHAKLKSVRELEF